MHLYLSGEEREQKLLYSKQSANFGQNQFRLVPKRHTVASNSYNPKKGS